MDSIKANKNRTPLRDNSKNGINNDDDISNTIYERVLNIVGFDDNDPAGMRYRYLTDYIVDTGEQLNGPCGEIKKALLNASVSKFKYEKQETKDMIKKCCDMYKILRGNSKISNIIGNMSKLINDFYIAHTESRDRKIASSDTTSNIESRYTKIAKDIVNSYINLSKSINGNCITQSFKNLFWKLLSIFGISQNQQEDDKIKSTVTSLLVGDAVSKFLSEAKTQHSRINYVAIKELLLSLQRKINSSKGTDTKVTKELIRDLFYGFGVQNSAWELENSIAQKLAEFSTEFGTINIDGKNFKIVDRGVELHNNCVFLSLKNKDQIFGPQTTGKDVKEYILEGAKKLKESLKNASKTKEDVKRLLFRCITCDLEWSHFNFTEISISSEKNNILTTILKGLNIDEFFNEFEEYKPEMFIYGAGSIYLLLLAIGMGKQIVIVDKDNKISKIFDPEKGLLTGIDAESENRSYNAIYVCMVPGHMMKLEQVDIVDNDTNKASINTEKENILSVINKKISMNKEVFSATKQVIKDAYEHFISDDGSKCNGDEFPQLHAAYGAITNQKLNSDEPNKQIAKLMSEALVEIAILRPLYWMDYVQKLVLNSPMLPILKKALTKYQDVLEKKFYALIEYNGLETLYNGLKTKNLSAALRESLPNMIELRRLNMKVSCIQREIEDESKKLPAVKKFFI